MESREIRESFLRFFEERGHLRLPSAPLVPYGDPTLLFTSAGMVQFKPYFIGEAEPPARRLATAQKCFRTSDIDSVGDASHLTFFEMLGNFSVGDYFKERAIPWAWEYVTSPRDKGGLGLAPERLWAAVYLDDDEAFRLWEQVGVPTDRIMRYGEESNYWFSGPVGPCGPCSEIHYDYGPTPGCPQCAAGSCHPEVECGRFLEIWNLVFMTYYQREDGTRTPLPAVNIDTGAGLERLAMVMQGVRSAYETDLFRPIIARIEELSGRRYGQEEATDRAMRVVAEHARAAAFLIADGVIPSNEGRGYVLRRIMRRAIYFGRHYLGLEDPFLTDVAGAVIRHMSDVYAELEQQRKLVLDTIAPEEQRFEETLSRGDDLLNRQLIPSHKEAAAVIKMWEQAIRSILSNREPESWPIFIDEANETPYGDLIGLTVLTGTGVRIPWDKVPHWLVGKTLGPLITNFRQETTELGSTLKTEFNHAMQELGAQNLADARVAARVGNRLATYRPQIEKIINTMTALASQIAATLTGAEAFVLHDTYGFPMELTREIAREHGFEVDEEGFERLMEEQRERGRAAARFGARDAGDVYAALADVETRFVGYETLRQETTVLTIIRGGEAVEAAAAGDEVEVVLTETPFYAEGGGQVGDRGEIVGPNGRVAVEDTQRVAERLIVHRGRVVAGRLAVGDAVTAQVDADHRYDTMRNHTATHLLHAALRRVLGSHVRQAGSLVAPDRLRFDYSHLQAPKPEELAQVQRLVNEAIRANLPVRIRHTNFRQAMDEGILAFFDEKYGEQVRVVEVLDEGGRVSGELCGGTHCSATGQIGSLVITSEGGIGAGMRRIEALTGRGAEEYVASQLHTLSAIARRLGTAPERAEARLQGLLEELEEERRRVEALERQSARGQIEDYLRRVEEVDGVRVLATTTDATSMRFLRELGDMLKGRLAERAVIVLSALIDGQPRFVALVTPDLTDQGVRADAIVGQVATLVGGSGGGRPEMAQGGGKDLSRLPDALRQVPGLVARALPKESGRG